MRIGVCLSCLTLISTFNSVAADWSQYKPVPLSQVWARALTGPTGPVPINYFEGALQNYKFVVKVVYTGKLRKMAPTRLELLSKWGKVVHAQDFARHFQNEIEVRSEGLTVWLALQDVLVAPLLRETKVGSPIEIWMMYVGAAQQDRVFLVNEFQAIN